MSGPADSKLQIRLEARARRNSLESGWRSDASRAIAERALQLPELESAAIVSAFVTLGSEVETESLLLGLIRLKGGVALPRLDPASGLLEHWWVGRLEGGFLQAGVFGIREPDPAACQREIHPREIELSFLPGLAFDRRGYRLGMGGGHYDRYFEAVPSPLKFGLAFSPQIVQHLPVEAHDIRLDGLITEKEVLRFPRSPAS